MVKIKLFFLVLKGEMNAWGKEFGLSQKEEKIRATGENDRVETVYLSHTISAGILVFRGYG